MVRARLIITYLLAISILCTITTALNGAGTLNGTGYTITALYVNRTTDEIGLFGVTQGTITNLNVNANITGNNKAGIIAGENTGNIII